MAGDWSDLYRRFLETAWGVPPAPDALRARYGWVDALHARARETLDPDALAALPPAEVYGRLRALGVPQCPIRVGNLGRVNEAADVVEALRWLVTEPGGFEAKYRKAKIPQTGRVTLTELLCAVKPHRFMVRNTAFLRAAPKVIPFYSRRALEELPYEEYLDLCRELARIQEAALAPAGLGAWAASMRYLLLYAILTEKKPKARR